MRAMPDIPNFLDRRPAKPLVYTFSILNAYLNCPEQMQRRYIAKDLGPYVETPEIAFGDKVHTAFEHRVGAGKPLPAEMEVWEQFAAPFDGQQPLVEQKLAMRKDGTACDFWDKDAWFRGKGDLTLIKDTTAYINDWKTGKSSYEHPFELQTNALLLKAKFPQLIKVCGSFTWLKENRVGQLYDLSDFRATWNQINEVIANIERDRAAGEWHKKQSGLCGWCSVKDCEHHRERT